ncbi:hypothetical protein [Streptomyces sp. ISL-86]|uniref:hypothetical protein n=1 Tax=Streptomyces sp. ISL-86 TaxID=2819187 RepID=UPI001BEB8ED3|nr:hypothetical protein [Streptomyces sp. ISL-86]MBT2455261.1 hypothetical protein [Streptomyces sp. ISL-86]
MRSALALRTSLVTAVITGTLLAPAAAAAFAATPQTVASTYGTVSDNSRYEGEPVYIGEGLVAVLRNKAEGPEAWIRVVGAGWKPGDTYLVRVAGLLNRTHTGETVNGLELKLTKADTATPVLTVTKAGVTKSYPLPKAESGQSCDSAHKTLPIGAGVSAELSMSASGPKALIRFAGSDKVWRTLDRNSSALPDSDGMYLRIANASGAQPVLEWKTQGGDTPVSRAAFPALPEGCTPEYPVKDDKPADPAEKCTSESKSLAIGAGVSAQLSMSASGPKALIRFAGSDKVWRTLDRNSSALPDSDGMYLRIANPSGAKPALEWKTQGGNAPVQNTDFPALPKGCKLDYPVKDDTATAKPTTAKPTTVSNTTTQTKGQTAVVPQGAVAAGAEVTAQDSDNTTTLAAGAGLLAVFAALGAGALRRRRSNV